jgi:hypothetical protein
MKKKFIPFHLRLLQGAIGKKFVIKQTKRGPVLSKFPVMNHIKPSDLQLKQRELFKDAVKYAKSIIDDPVRKIYWEKRLSKKHKIFTQLIKIYFQKVRK